MRSTNRPPSRRRWVTVVTASVVLISACGSGSSKVAGPEPQRTVFDPANFVGPAASTNPWQPLVPGTQWVREGTTEVGSRVVPHQVITTVTDVVRVIDGVTTLAVLDQDTDAGQITQVSIDYVAADRQGNVWILGGYTEDFEAGVFTNSHDSWLGAASGDPGILVPRAPTASTPRWHIGEPFTDEPSAGEVVETGAHQCVPFACYDNVLIVREGKVSAIDNEFKFYAPGVGLILNSPKKDSKHKDTEELVNLTQLSRVGLTETSSEVMQLEAHARQTQPRSFGGAAASTRLP